MNSTSPVFDEKALLAEIEKQWGKHGAHAEVMRELLKKLDYLTDLSHQRALLARLLKEAQAQPTESKETR